MCGIFETAGHRAKLTNIWALGGKHVYLVYTCRVLLTVNCSSSGWGFSPGGGVGWGTSYSKQYRYVPRKCPCFQPVYSQFAHAKSQFYNAYKIYCVMVMTFHDNSSKIFSKVMPKTDPSIKFRPWESIYAYINSYRTNYSSESTPKVYFHNAPRIWIFLSRCLCRAGCPYHFYIGSASPGVIRCISDFRRPLS